MRSEADGDAGSMSQDAIVTLRHIADYRFEVDFGGALPALAVDEAEPIGTGEGPFPEQLLTAAVANCLCASLVFALAKYRQRAISIAAQARAQVERNAAGRLRMTGITVEIALGAEAASLDRIDRVLAQFQNFCTVSESVKAGIPVAVTVSDSAGRLLSESHAVASPTEDAP
jgi:organic hydroperoxide reductase OsmC/OhrA